MRTFAERFWAKVEKTDTCWLWTGSCNCTGYGTFWDGAKVQVAHRASLFIRDGVWPSMPVDHLCRVRNCVNPAHLEQVSFRENILRGEGLAAKQARQTHCKRGHPLVIGNLLKCGERKRKCLICHNANNLAAYHRRRASASSLPSAQSAPAGT